MEEHHIKLQILYDNLYHYDIKSKDCLFLCFKSVIEVSEISKFNEKHSVKSYETFNMLLDVYSLRSLKLMNETLQ